MDEGRAGQAAGGRVVSGKWLLGSSWGGFIFLLVVRHFGVRIVYFMVWGEASDVHDVKDTIFRAYDGLRWVETFRRLDRFLDKSYDGLGRDYSYYASALSLCSRLFYRLVTKDTGKVHILSSTDQHGSARISTAGIVHGKSSTAGRNFRRETNG